MHPIDHFNLKSFDLNLLVAFDALMQELSVTNAANRLRIGQSAMSHSLATLRVLFADELFVRVGQKMVPTTRARSLAGQVRTALAHAQLALDVGETFEPATEERLFRIGLTREMEITLLPELANHVRSFAPKVRLLSRTLAHDGVDTALDTHQIDLAIGWKNVSKSRFRSEVLFDAELACCFDPSMVGTGATLSRAEYLAGRHAVVSETESIAGCLGAALAAQGLELNVVVAAHDHMPLLAAARGSALIATVPRCIALQYAPLFSLQTAPMPLAVDLPSISMNWAASADNDQGNVWLRTQIRDVTGSWAVPTQMAAQ
jgi:LysR family transcriptional regulator, mexEF-oprN operon transcriptional activator